MTRELKRIKRRLNGNGDIEVYKPKRRSSRSISQICSSSPIKARNFSVEKLFSEIR